MSGTTARPVDDAPAYTAERRHPVELILASLADARPTPYWTDALAAVEAAPALQGDIETDLLVVGGGYCGLWTALLAKERDPDREVVLIEGRRIGWAASSRNGGFCEATLTHGVANGRRRFAAELDDIRREEQENFAGLRATLERYDMQVEFENAGVLAVATEPHQVEALRSAAGPHARFLDGSELTGLIRSPLHRAGLFKTDGYALVNPARLVGELRRVCLQLGVRIHESTPALRIRKAPSGVAVRTRGGTITAQRVALATNGFPSPLRRLRLWTIPVYDYALMTEPLTPAQLEAIGWVGRHGLTDSGRQFHYARKTADDRILWGGFDAVYHRGGRILDRHDQREETFERLADHFFSTFPALEDVRFTHKWGGMIDMSTRLVATQGTALGGAVAYSIGYTGLGVAATRFGAAAMLDMLDGLQTRRTSLRLTVGLPFPVPPEPLANPLIQLVRRAVAKADENGGRSGLLLRTLEKLGIDFDS
ncbi:FAD-binding oxidoreductase [Microbacterium sp. OR21]|uniref:NAD(P)/FAD-dependent oxidoreductase n=1 Tax=Microbacterium sp. OR21 TaxID=3095346 RepID=UPI0039B4EE3B